MANTSRAPQAPLPLRVTPVVAPPPPPPPAPSDPNVIDVDLGATEESPAFELELETPDTNPEVSPYYQEARPKMLSYDLLYAVDPDTERKSSAYVTARRAHFQQVVTAIVGAIWIFCQVAVVQATLRSLLFD